VRHTYTRTVWFFAAPVVAVLVFGVAGGHAQEADGQIDDEPATSPAPIGQLAGRVEIGPLQPVERVGVPSPTPSPAACTARGLILLTPDGQTEVMRVSFQPDCTYQVELPAGEYRVQLQPLGIDRSRDLPQTVTILDGQTTGLDISIDTGIR
jgi:hypothetical protein